MKNVDDIYPVTPMQKMMLLHSVSRSANNPLFNQFCYDVDAPFDAGAFRGAWQSVVADNSALRTGFIWENVKEPLQVVRKRVSADFSELDWRQLSIDQTDQKLSQFLADDRKLGFDLRRAPLMRFCLIRLTESSWRFIWSSHHLIIDRWCLANILAEVQDSYASEFVPASGRSKQGNKNFRTYVDWIHRQDSSKAYAYWSSQLRGLSDCTSMTLPDIGSPEPLAAPNRHAETHLAVVEVDKLRTLAKKLGVTLSAIMQGAWSLTMNRLLEKQDIVFGATVSGRPTDIPNVESIVGSFINNVPIRVQLDAEIAVEDWLTGIQAGHFARLPYEYMAPSEIRRCTRLTESQPLFDSLLVWLNQVVQTGNLPMRPVSAQYATAYPLTLSIQEHSDSLMLRFDASKRCIVDLPELLTELVNSIHTLLVAQPQTLLADLPEFRIDRSAVDCSSSANEWHQLETDMRDTDTTDATGGRERLGTDVLRDLLRVEWLQVLGLTEFQEDADFFELGGTSLQAASLHARVEKVTGQSIPVLALFQDPTIEKMVQVLFEKDWPLRADITNRLRTSGTGPGLFCIASPEVNAVGYAIMTRHLPASQNVFTLQAPPESHQLHQVNPESLPTIAEEYISAMQATQSEGPYRLMGMCTGSHIALEMARQLESRGESIDFFGVINTWSLYTISRLYIVNRYTNILRYYAGRVRDLVPVPAIAQPAGVVATDQRSIAQQTEIVDAESTDGHGNAWIRDVGFASKDPNSAKVDMPITVFRLGSQPYWRINDESLGWSKRASRTHVIRIAGTDHDSILRNPNVKEIGTAISNCLAALNTSSSASVAPHRQSSGE